MVPTHRHARVLCFVVLVAACRNGDRALDAAQNASREAELPRVAEIYFTTEVSGYVEPCGCTTKPLGGVQRLASVIGAGHVNRVLVDAGNLILPTTQAAMERDQHRLKSHVLARVYRRLGAVALNLGESDLSEGTELLKDLQREGAVPFVSANVRPVGEAGPSVARSVLRVIGDIRVGFTGVTTPERIAGIRGVTSLEYAPAVRAEVANLRKEGAELVVVLAHVGEVGARELARAVPDIDVIIRAPGTPIESEPHPPERVGDVVIVEAGSQGQHVGRLTLNFGLSSPERPLPLDDGGQRQEKRRRHLARKIEAYRTELEAWGANPSMAEASKAKRAQIEALEAELAAPAGRTPPPTGAHLRVELVPLSSDIRLDAEVGAILGSYYAQLRSLNLEKGDVAECAPSRAQPVFVGSERCASCHEEAFAFWKRTKHAGAWATLEEQGKHFDLTCVGCHTIGFRTPGGFCRLKDVGALKDVGCESCHGAGSQHVEDGDPSSITRVAPEATCKSSCHVPEHSDRFVYEEYVREITGKGHERSAPAAGSGG